MSRPFFPGGDDWHKEDGIANGCDRAESVVADAKPVSTKASHRAVEPGRPEESEGEGNDDAEEERVAVRDGGGGESRSAKRCRTESDNDAATVAEANSEDEAELKGKAEISQEDDEQRTEDERKKECCNGECGGDGQERGGESGQPEAKGGNGKDTDDKNNKRDEGDGVSGGAPSEEEEDSEDQNYCESDSSSTFSSDDDIILPPKPCRTKAYECPQLSEAFLDLEDAERTLSQFESNLEKARIEFESARRRYVLAMENRRLCAAEVRRLKRAVVDADLAVDCKWNRMYRRLLRYKFDNGGDTMVPTAYVPKGVDPDMAALRNWVARQRKVYREMQQGQPRAGVDVFERRGRRYARELLPHRVAALEKAGFVWSADGARWDRRVEDLAEYRRKYGNCVVPYQYKDDRALAHWVHKQRREYRFYMQGRPSEMTEERIRHLDGMGFVWKVDKNRRGSDWDKGKSDADVGAAGANASDGVEGSSKGASRKKGRIRKRKRRRRANYNEAQTEEEEWNKSCALLEAYRSHHGHCRVGAACSDLSRPEAKRLKDFSSWQRKQYRLYVEGKESTLTEDRVARLNDLGFDWAGKGKWVWRSFAKKERKESDEVGGPRWQVGEKDTVDVVVKDKEKGSPGRFVTQAT